MEEIIKLVVDNGIAVACFIAFIYFIFNDKKESNLLFQNNNEILKKVNDTLVEIKLNLQQLNDRVAVLETKHKKEDK